MYMFHKVNRDISRALNAPSLDGVEDGGDALPGLCPIGGGVPLLNSLFNSFTYSTMRASNSDGAIPGIGPRATQFLQTLVRHAIFQDIDLGLCKCRANTGRRERIKRAISDPSGEPFVGEHLAIEKLGAASTNRVSKPPPARFDVSTNDLSKLRFRYLSVRAAYTRRLSPPLASTFETIVPVRRGGRLSRRRAALEYA